MLAEAQHGLELQDTTRRAAGSVESYTISRLSLLIKKRQGEHVARLEKEKESLLIRLKNSRMEADTKLEEPEAQILPVEKSTPGFKSDWLSRCKISTLN